MAEEKKKTSQDPDTASGNETVKDPEVEAKPAADTKNQEQTEKKKKQTEKKKDPEKEKAKADSKASEKAEVKEAEAENAASDSESGKKSFFKKKEKKDPKDEKIAEMTDRLQRQMAEFDNFRKRTEKEKSQMFDIGAKSVIEKLLPVVDNFERGLENCDKDDPFADGMMKIYKQLTSMLTDLGVTPIEAVGKEFDPDFHNAVMHTEDESVGENIVVEEFQKGYLYKDSVVRHSMVKVAN